MLQRDDLPKLFRQNNEGVAVFVGELDVPLTEAISDLKDVGYITFAKPKDNTKQRLYLSRPENRCFSNFSQQGVDPGGCRFREQLLCC